MIRAQLFDPGSGETTIGGPELIGRWKGMPDAKVWVDFDGVEPADERKILADDFGLNHRAISEAQLSRRPPKIEQFEEHTFVLLKGLDANTDDIEFNTIQLGLFIADRFLITRHAERSLSTDRLWGMTQSGERALEKGCDTLGVALMNIVVDRYLPILLAVEDRLELLEDEVTANPHDSLLSELIVLKSNLTRMQRVMANHVHVFEEALSAQLSGVGHSANTELRLVYEKLERARSLSSLYYDLAADLRDGYISLASHRLNNIMKVLTVVASIFIPLTFIAGIYGMNFEYIPELAHPNGYFILLGTMAVIGVGLLVLFRRNKWL
ncbi:MAG: magnesium/cobalt transporter CorA [Alphaproteobacteria bacterium]